MWLFVIVLMCVRKCLLLCCLRLYVCCICDGFVQFQLEIGILFDGCIYNCCWLLCVIVNICGCGYSWVMSISMLFGDGLSVLIGMLLIILLLSIGWLLCCSIGVNGGVQDDCRIRLVSLLICVQVCVCMNLGWKLSVCLSVGCSVLCMYFLMLYVMRLVVMVLCVLSQCGMCDMLMWIFGVVVSFVNGLL